jgi:hypothetical protein
MGRKTQLKPPKAKGFGDVAVSIARLMLAFRFVHYRDGRRALLRR